MCHMMWPESMIRPKHPRNLTRRNLTRRLGGNISRCILWRLINDVVPGPRHNRRVACRWGSVDVAHVRQWLCARTRARSVCLHCIALSRVSGRARDVCVCVCARAHARARAWRACVRACVRDRAYVVGCACVRACDQCEHRGQTEKIETDSDRHNTWCMTSASSYGTSSSPFGASGLCIHSV